MSPRRYHCGTVCYPGSLRGGGNRSCSDESSLTARGRLYDAIGERYDATRCADPYITGRLIHHLRVCRSGRYLEVACGTGNYSVALARSGGHIYGIDESRRMIRAARAKSSRVVWSVGSAEALPFRGGGLGGAYCVLAVHHFPDLLGAFTEAARVLAAGRLVVFTSTSEQMRDFWLNAYFPEAMAKSIAQMPGRREIVDALGAAGFTRIEIEAYNVTAKVRDLFLYSGKQRPELYLDTRVRRGISTFALLAEPQEVECGCRRLASDLRSGQFKQVCASFPTKGGDYCFVVARK